MSESDAVTVTTTDEFGEFVADYVSHAHADGMVCERVSGDGWRIIALPRGQSSSFEPAALFAACPGDGDVVKLYDAKGKRVVLR